jgi:ABC-type transport system substrate-binding protein
VKEIKEGRLAGYALAEAPYAAYRQFTFNVADPPFNNPKLRQALAHAIDKHELGQAAGFGFGGPAEQRYPKGNTWYVEGVPTPGYDPEKARALLREAGYTGQPIDIYIESAQDVQAATTTLQAQFKKVGVDIRIHVLDYSAYRVLIEKGEFGFAPFMGSGFFADPVTTYRPELACGQDIRKRASNFSGYCDKDMDALIERLETEMNPATRRDLLRQIIAKQAQDLSSIPLLFIPRFFGMRDFVKGFETGDDGAFLQHGGGLNYTWLDK